MDRARIVFHTSGRKARKLHANCSCSTCQRDLMSRLTSFCTAAFAAAALATAVGAQAPAIFDYSHSDLRYRMVGPDRGGRVTTVTGVASEPRTFYMGVASGGLWK